MQGTSQPAVDVPIVAAYGGRRFDVRLAVALWSVIAAGLVFMARGLPARAFFAGDPGVKLIAARNAIEHPSRPLDIDLLTVAGQQVGLMDPFFRVHGNHAHATTSELFPLISAPLIAAFGIRGAYVLPAIGFLLTLGAIAVLGVALDNRRSLAALVFVAAACTPLLFYALEFWEHAVAVGVAAAGTVLFVSHRSLVSTFVSGALLGIAMLLRPEGAWYGAALFICAGWMPKRPNAYVVVAAIAGLSAMCVPFGVVSAIQSGQLLGAHVTSNLPGMTTDWLTERTAVFRTWFVPPNVLWFGSAVLLVIAAVGTKDKPTLTRVVAAAGLAFAVIVTVAAARRTFDAASVWNAEPALLLPWVLFIGRRSGRTFLLAVALLSSLLVVLTAPNDGGAQWSPRYLLFASIPLSILAADTIDDARRIFGVTGTVAVVVLLVACLLVQRNAYKSLQAAKRTYERIVQFVERETPVGSYIVTDLWWLDQVTAALYPTRVMLFVDDAGSVRQASELLATVPKVFIARSTEESPPDALQDWQEGTPFSVRRRASIEERSLTLVELNRR